MPQDLLSKKKKKTKTKPRKSARAAFPPLIEYPSWVTPEKNAIQKKFHIIFFLWVWAE